MLISDRKRAVKMLIMMTMLSFAANLLLPGAQSAPSVEKQKDISVGGTVGFADLANPKNTARLRATGRVNLYIHDYIWTRTPDSQKAAILKVFKDTGPQWVELGAVHHAEEYWSSNYKKLYIDNGVNAVQAHCNLGVKNTKTQPTLEEWKAFVDGGKALGFKVIAPVFSPSTLDWASAPFTDPKWDTYRIEAKYGGGLTIDCPPNFFLHMQVKPDFQKFVLAQIHWARSRNIQSTWIISPNIAGAQFRDKTIEFLKVLEADDALPDCWIVENYRPEENVTPDYPNAIGAETNPESISGVALWLAEHSSQKL